MENQIIVKLELGKLEHTIYILTNDTENTTIEKKVAVEDLVSMITMSAAKYKIKTIKLCGPKTYSFGIKEQLLTKINTCFGKTDGFTIELM